MNNRILLVEDDKVISQFLRSVLQQAGYSVEHAICLIEARFMVKEVGNYELAVVDLMLPDGEGIDLLPDIKKKWPEIPIIILTSVEPDTEIVEECLANGASVYLSKSSSPDQLLLQIKTLLAG